MKKYPGVQGSPKKLSTLTKFRLWCENILENENFLFVMMMFITIICCVPFVGFIFWCIYHLFNYFVN